MLAEKLGLDAQKLLRHLVEVVGAMLVDDDLLPGAGAGADVARQPRLQGGLHRGDDAQGPQARPGCRQGRRRGHAARRGRGENLRAISSKRARGRAISPASSASSAAADRCRTLGGTFVGTFSSSRTLHGPTIPDALTGGLDGRCCCRHRYGCASALGAEGAVRKMPAAGGRMPSRVHGQGAGVRLQLQVRRAQRRGRHQHPAARHQQRPPLHHPFGLGVPLQDLAGRPAADSELRAAVGFDRPARLGQRRDAAFGRGA